MTTEEIKKYITDNKICIVTNSTLQPSSLFLPSLKTYINYIPNQNFHIIPGLININQVNYGLSAFIDMLIYMLSSNNFDYVIYLDEDVFINDFSLLINEFELFKTSDSCLAGIQDGGSLCHRNHSKLLINTFISFWNIKLYREHNIIPDKIIKYIHKFEKDNSYNQVYANFLYTLKLNYSNLYELMDNKSNHIINEVKNYMINHCNTPNHESEYANIVRNDTNNPTEPHQTPYSFDDYTATYNFEPYYFLEQYLILKTNKPIYYLFATDFIDDEYKNICDTSGLTSAVRTSDSSHKLIAVHTWFSRAYNKFNNNSLCVKHTNRIDSIINKFSY